jgi:hypothetical protein
VRAACLARRQQAAGVVVLLLAQYLGETPPPGECANAPRAIN